MVGRNACSGPAQNEGRPYFPMLCLPTYHIQDWTIFLIEARWVSRVHLSGGTCGNDCSRVNLHHFSHTRHGFHHCGHLLFHGLYVGLHLLLHLLYFTHHSSSGTYLVRVSLNMFFPFDSNDYSSDFKERMQ